MKHFAILCAGMLMLTVAVAATSGDVFILSSGGRVEGELLNPDQQPRETYVIRLPSGGQISLQAAQVKEVQAVRPDQAEYEKVRPQYPDTAAGQWNLAEWCREHGLSAQRKTHLQRVIELDPEHVEARRLLGYTKIEGKWTTQDEMMLKQGYRKYKNQWKLPQEIELLENKRKQEAAEKEWFTKIKRWRNWLDGDRAKQGRENLLAIDDPTAVKALALGLIHEKAQEMRLLYIEVLGKIGTREADATLALCSIEDDVEEIRLSCLDVLEKHKSPELTAYYVGRMSKRDVENVIVVRAAIALRRLKDPSSIGPLINALVTTHKRKISEGNPGQMSMSFPSGGASRGGGGGIGMGMGGSGPKIVVFHVQNQPVLDALVAVTGQNFSYDQRAWRTWHASQANKAQGLDARRN